MPPTPKDWKKDFIYRFVGTKNPFMIADRVSTDEVIEFINSLLQEQQAGFVEKIEGSKQQESYIASFNIVKDESAIDFNRGLDTALTIIRDR